MMAELEDRAATQSREIRALAAQVVSEYGAGTGGAWALGSAAERLQAVWQSSADSPAGPPAERAALAALSARVVGTAADQESATATAGGQAFAAVGMTVPLLLLCGALPRWFSQPAVARALAALGPLATVTAVLAAEAIEFVVAAMVPGGLVGGSAARRQALRLSHIVATIAEPPAGAPAEPERLTLPLLQQLVLACVPCLYTDLRRLGTVESTTQTETQSIAMYARFCAACTLIGLGDALPRTLAAALVASADAEDLSGAPPEPATEELKEEVLRHLAFILPGTALDELPRPLTDHLLHPERPAAELAQVLRRAATALWISTEGLDDLMVIRRITRMVSSTMLIGLAGWQPTPERQPIVLPPGLATGLQGPAAT
jgi:hypothetical protein